MGLLLPSTPHLSSCGSHCPGTTSWDPTYIKPQASAGQNGLFLIAFLDSRQRSIRPDLERPAIAILRSSHKADKTKPQAKSFKELVSRPGQRSQLAAPGYADSTKLGTVFIWGRWTKYVDSSIHGPHLSSWAEANNVGPRFRQKAYEESNYFTTSDPVDVCRSGLTPELCWH